MIALSVLSISSATLTSFSASSYFLSFSYAVARLRARTVGQSAEPGVLVSELAPRRLALARRQSLALP